MRSFKIVNAVVITVNHSREIFADGAVAVAGDSIVGVGRAEDLRHRFCPTSVLDVGGGIVHPGFVDGHVHISQHLGRGMIPDSWPEEREHEQWKPYWLHMSRDDARCSAMLACLEMLRNGTTTFADNGGRFNSELNAEVIEAVGLRGMVSEVCWDLPPYPEVATPGYGSATTTGCLERLERLCKKYPWRRGSRVWAGVSMAGMALCSDELLVGGTLSGRQVWRDDGHAPRLGRCEPGGCSAST